MDEVDRKILAILKKDGKMPFVEIADSIGMTEGAVRIRIGKLVKDKVIKKFTIETTEEIKSIVFVNTSSSIPTTEVAKRIRELHVEDVYEVSGDYDIICLVKAADIHETNRIVENIRKIKGVLQTNTCMVLK
ncbi:AsnC family transcriptional regulator [archaeon]|nr:MAG: AsnC family transcriptional regulator [archaeon]